MSAKIGFLSRALAADERKPVPAVRPDAIVKRDGRDVVFVVTRDEKSGDERVKAQPVTVGAKVGRPGARRPRARHARRVGARTSASPTARP